MGFVSANQVTIGYTAASREDALHYLSEQAIELGFADDASAVEAAFIARENEAETGLVAGFAVPHAKSDAIHTPGVAVLKLTEPVEWPSFDGKRHLPKQAAPPPRSKIPQAPFLRFCFRRRSLL